MCVIFLFNRPLIYFKECVSKMLLSPHFRMKVRGYCRYPRLSVRPSVTLSCDMNSSYIFEGRLLILLQNGCIQLVDAHESFGILKLFQMQTRGPKGSNILRNFCDANSSYIFEGRLLILLQNGCIQHVDAHEGFGVWKYFQM